jgi:hypothetical protein
MAAPIPTHMVDPYRRVRAATRRWHSPHHATRATVLQDANDLIPPRSALGSQHDGHAKPSPVRQPIGRGHAVTSALFGARGAKRTTAPVSAGHPIRVMYTPQKKQLIDLRASRLPSATVASPGRRTSTRRSGPFMCRRAVNTPAASATNSTDPHRGRSSPSTTVIGRPARNLKRRDCAGATPKRTSTVTIAESRAPTRSVDHTRQTVFAPARSQAAAPLPTTATPRPTAPRRPAAGHLTRTSQADGRGRPAEIWLARAAKPRLTGRQTATGSPPILGQSIAPDGGCCHLGRRIRLLAPPEGRSRSSLMLNQRRPARKLTSPSTKHGHSRRPLSRHSRLPLPERSGHAIASLGCGCSVAKPIRNREARSPRCT